MIFLFKGREFSGFLCEFEYGSTYFGSMIPELFPFFWGQPSTQMISIDFPGCHWSSRRRCCGCSSTRARKAAAVADENAYISPILTNIHQTKLFTLFGACSHHSTYPPSSCSSSHKVINVLTVPDSFYVFPPYPNLLIFVFPLRSLI